LVAAQLREARSARRLDATLAVFRDLGSDRNRSLRRFVYNDLHGDPENYTPETMAKVESLSGSLERAAFLWSRSLIDEALILDMYAEAFLRSWRALAPWVALQRRVRGQRYLRDFEALARRSHRYWEFPERPVSSDPVKTVSSDG
jgi:hypothetical protein